MISAQAAAASGARTGRAGDFGGFRTRWALLISVAGGLALYASFPPTDAWPLAVLGPALLVLALTGRSLRGSFGCALAFGLAQFVPLLSWLINEAWYAWAALAGSEAVIFALLAIGQRLLLRLPYWPVAVAGWWVLVEGMRDRWPYAFPWGRLAMSQSVAPDVRWVAFGGAPLLSFLIALTGAMLAGAVLAWLGPEGRARWTASAAAVVTAGLVLAGGLLPANPVGGAPTAQVAAIQGNVPRARNLPQLINDTQVTQNHAEATLKLAAQVKAGQRPAARPGDLAGKRHRPGPVPDPRHLRHDLLGCEQRRASGPGRRGAERPPAQRWPALAARPRADHVLRQAPAGAVR